MTPRGVADVNVYTPERVEARLGITPDAGAGLHRAEGRHLRQHPGRPRDRRQDGVAADPALRLAGRGARARRRADAGTRARRSPSMPTRRATRRSSRPCAATSTSTATRPSSCSPRPTAPQLAEMFRRFEFRALLQRVDQLDEALPAAAPREVKGEPLPWREAELADVSEVVAGSPPTRTASRSRPTTAWSSGRGARSRRVRGARRRARRQGASGSCRADDTLLAAYLIEPGRASYELDDLAIEYGAELEPEPGDRRGDGGARPPRRRCRRGSSL